MAAVLALFSAALLTVAIERTSRDAWLLWLEHWSGDWRTSWLSDRPESQHPGVAVITLTDETLEPLPYRAPIDRAYIARLVTEIARHRPRAIGIDFVFLRRTEAQKDRLLQTTLGALGVPVVLAVADRPTELSDAERALQDAFVNSSGAQAGYANLLTSSDGKVRYVPRVFEGSPYALTFAEAVSGKRLVGRTEENRRIAWLLSPSDGSDTFFNLPAHLLLRADGAPPDPLGAALAPKLAGRIVLIGADLPDIDRHATPLQPRDGAEVAGVLIHAQLTAQLLDGRAIRLLGGSWLLSLLFALVVAGILVGVVRGWQAYALIGTSVPLALVALDFALFHAARTLLPFGACLVALVAGLFAGAIVRWLIGIFEVQTVAVSR